MSKQNSLKKAAVTLGLSVFALSGVFNGYAANDDIKPDGAKNPNTLSVGVPANDRAPASITLSPKQEKLNADLLNAFEDINTHLSGLKPSKDYAADKDAYLNGRIDEIIRLIKSGADANIDPKGRIALPGAGPLSALHSVILLAGPTLRPDLVDAFIRNGADLHRVDAENRNAMDFAVLTFLLSKRSTKNDPVPSGKDIYNAARILKLMKDAGLSLANANIFSKEKDGTPITYNHIAIDMLSLKALYDNTLISDAEFNASIKGAPQLAQEINTATGVSEDMIRKNGGMVVKDFVDAVPGGPEPLTIKPGDTLKSIATRFSKIMGSSTIKDAVEKIASLNKITLIKNKESVPLQAGDTILIPLPPENMIGAAVLKENSSLRQLAQGVKPYYYDQSMSIEDIARDLAKTNGIKTRNIDDATALKAGEKLAIGYFNDTYSHLAALKAPAEYKGTRHVELLIIEDEPPEAKDSGKTPHIKETFRVAASTGYAINRAVDLSRFHIIRAFLMQYPALGTSDALRILMNAGDSPARDRFVFSHSMAVKGESWESEDQRNKRSADNLEYESVRLMLDNIEKARPTIFTASGNFWPDEGRYRQSFLATHSPHSVIIGAAGKYAVAPSKGGAAKVIAPYSSYGADVCSPLPVALGKQMEGTSFATPLTAAIYRQLAEWYGDSLSFEEIMAAGLMSADRDIGDYTDAAQMTKRTWTHPEEIKTATAQYRTNGAGLPHHERCGAGIINVENWQKSLDKMMLLKKPGQDAEGTSTKLSAGSPSEIMTDANGKPTRYIYRIAVPASQTLGKITFLLPQNKNQHSDVVVRTPAGYEMLLPKSYTDVISTFALAYEDVQEGQFIEIHTGKPLAETAGIILRGNAPGNAIALLRDQLRMEGILPAPLRDLSGNRDTGPSTPVTFPDDAPKVTLPPKLKLKISPNLS